MTNQITLTFSEPSLDPASVIQVWQEAALHPDSVLLGPHDVLIEFLAAPINPQDFLVIGNRYPIKPAYTHSDYPIPGYDGVCRVVRAGNEVEEASNSSMKVGDHAIPRRYGLGTWRSHAVVNSQELIKVPRELDVVAASILKMGVAPAWLLLRERSTLIPGDWVVLNAAGGVIAQMVVQFARLQGLHTLSVIRDRDEDGYRQTLLTAGSDIVMTESQLAASNGLVPEMQRKRVVLALDAVFGPSGKKLVGLLTPGATYVNYGSLGGADKELPLSQKDVFWNEITFKTFRLSKLLGKLSEDEFVDLLSWFSEYFLDGRLKVPVVEQVLVTGGSELESSIRSILQKVTDKSRVGVKKQVLVFSH